jgi:hypothetical protein
MIINGAQTIRSCPVFMWQMNALACALDDFVQAQLIDRIII